MKITKSILQKIIKEEIENLSELEEGWSATDLGARHSTERFESESMGKLKDIVASAYEAHGVRGEDQDEDEYIAQLLDRVVKWVFEAATSTFGRNKWFTPKELDLRDQKKGRV